MLSLKSIDSFPQVFQRHQVSPVCQSHSVVYPLSLPSSWFLRDCRDTGLLSVGSEINHYITLGLIFLPCVTWGGCRTHLLVPPHLSPPPQAIPAPSPSRTRFCLWKLHPCSQCNWASLAVSAVPTLHCKMVNFLHIQWAPWGQGPHLTHLRIPSIVSSAWPPEGTLQTFDEVDPSGSKRSPICFPILNTLPFLILTKCKVRLVSLSWLCDWV